MEFSWQEYWRGLPFPSPGALPDPGIEPGSPALLADSLDLSHQGGPNKQPFTEMRKTSGVGEEGYLLWGETRSGGEGNQLFRLGLLSLCVYAQPLSRVQLAIRITGRFSTTCDIREAQ